MSLEKVIQSTVSIGMIGLQSRGGLVFGQTLGIEPGTIHFEADARITEGERITWRMELTGWEGTVSGELEVLRADRRPGSPVRRFRARITAFHDDDERLFNQWLREREEGGTSHDPQAKTKKLNPLGALNQMVGSSDAERKHALGRIQERRERARKRRVALQDDSATPLSDPSGLGLASETATNAVEAKRGRSAIRGALRERMESVSQLSASGSAFPGSAGTPLSSLSALSSASASASSVSATDLSREGISSLGAASTPEARARKRAQLREAIRQREARKGPRTVRSTERLLADRLPDPVAELIADPVADLGPDEEDLPTEPPRPAAAAAPAAPPDTGIRRLVELRPGTPPVLEVTYPSLASLTRDWFDGLDRSGLVVPPLLPVDLGRVVRCELHLPGGRQIVVDARVVAELGARGVALHLELGRRYLSELRTLVEETTGGE